MDSFIWDRGVAAHYLSPLPGLLTKSRKRSSKTLVLSNPIIITMALLVSATLI